MDTPAYEQLCGPFITYRSGNIRWSWSCCVSCVSVIWLLWSQEVRILEKTCPGDVDVLQGWLWEKTAEGSEGSFSRNTATAADMKKSGWRQHSGAFFKGGRMTGLAFSTLKEVCFYFHPSILWKIENLHLEEDPSFRCVCCDKPLLRTLTEK